MKKFFEERLDGKTIYEGRILTLEVDRVRLDSGAESVREYVKHRGGAAVLVVDGAKNVRLVRQFRYPYKEVLYEIPAGKLEEGEAPLDAAVRELSEETGVLARRLTEMGVIYPSPGYTDEKLYIYLAEDFETEAPHTDIDEELDAVTVPLEQALRMIDSGEIKDAKTCYALLKYALEHGIRG